MSLLVTAVNPDGSAGVTSNASASVQATPPVNTAVPTTTGSALRTSMLTSTQGAWSGIGNAYVYQWQRSADQGVTWTDIAGASTPTYTLAVADERTRVHLLVIAANADGSASAASAASAAVQGGPPVNTAPPTISGIARRASTLGSTQGLWNGIGNTYAYQWQRSANGSNWTSIDGATGPTYTLVPADEHAIVHLLVTAANDDASVSTASVATVTVPSAPPVNTIAPAIAGAAQRTSTLSSTQGSWDGIGNAYAYQWQSSSDRGQHWTNIAGATGQSYQLVAADEGSTVRILTAATNPDGDAIASSAATAAVQAAPPLNSVAPAVSGSAQRSSTLSSTQGSWSGPDNVYAGQWQRSAGGNNWTDIAGASGPTYTLAVADENSAVRLLVTATNPDGNLSVGSVASASVPSAPPVNTCPPTVTGIAQRAATLSLTSNGCWTPTSSANIGNSYSQQWQRSAGLGSWTDIAGAVGSTYTLAVADENSAVRLLVTATNPDGSLSVTSVASANVPSAPPVNTCPPSVTGIAQRAATLSLTGNGCWTPTSSANIGNSYSQQWQRSAGAGMWTDLDGATGSTYTPVTGDEGTRLRVQVTATNADATVSAASAASGSVQAAAPVNTAPPTLSGLERVQRTFTLRASVGSWDGAGNTFAYQWQHSANGSTWTPIDGATSSTYTLAQADEARNVRAVVTATNLDGGAVAPSAGSAAVQAAPPLNATAPSISGSPRIGATLTANAGGWSPADTTFSYDWQRSAAGGYQDIPAASGSTYTLAQADAGNTVRVRIAAINVDGTVSATSAATASVAQPPRSLRAAAAPSGTLQDSFTLSADPGTWDTSGVSYGYSWLRCDAGATSVGGASCTPVGSGSRQYTLTVADVGHPMAVSVTATSSIGGSSTPVASALTDAVAGRPLISLTPPTISGEPRVPNTLSANPGTWSVPFSAISYTWQRCDGDGSSNCTTLAVNTSQYTLVGPDNSHTIVLWASATSPGRTQAAHSLALSVQNPTLPEATVAPAITGTPARANLLRATPGVWTGNPTLSYVWQVCNPFGQLCQEIPGATGLSYLPAKADEGSAITIKVLAANAAGASTASAAATTPVAALPPVNTNRPAVTAIGYQQSVQVGIVGDAWQTDIATSYSAAWLRCDASGANCTLITGALSGLYTPTGADVGHSLVGVITATNTDASVPASSAPTPVLTAAAPRWKTLPTLTADAASVGATLTVKAGWWGRTRNRQRPHATDAMHEHVRERRSGERRALHDRRHRPRRNPARQGDRVERRRRHDRMVVALPRPRRVRRRRLRGPRLGLEHEGAQRRRSRPRSCGTAGRCRQEPVPGGSRRPVIAAADGPDRRAAPSAASFAPGPARSRPWRAARPRDAPACSP